MTRQEELNEAWCKYMGKCSTEILHALAFALRWCDQHPNWISVEDELPKFYDNVLYCDEDGDYYTETDNIGQDVKITHWMRIPDCPPLQDFENKLRTALNGENEKGGEQ